MKNKYTSLELSKKLVEAGCKLGSEAVWFHSLKHPFQLISKKMMKYTVTKEGFRDQDFQYFNAYDLLWDICVKHAKEFFGGELQEKTIKGITVRLFAYLPRISRVVSTLQQGKKQEAEDYIWEHCKFNRKDKK